MASSAIEPARRRKTARTRKRPGRNGLPAYVLITPARNEAAFIGQTIESVLNQTVRPVKWIIVSDGSTDGTDDMVRTCAQQHRWIELVRTPERTERHFAGKVFAFNAGYERVKGLDFDVIGNLDADVSFEPDFFAFLLEKFASLPHLGVAGAAFNEGLSGYDYRYTNIEHVSGACQLFRRACFEGIGGYVPIRAGGIDWTAVTTARMKGWQTRTFPERRYRHLRSMGTGMSSRLGARFRFGRQDYYLGGHPVWQVFRSLYQMRHRPFLLGGMLLLAGYFWAMVSGVEKVVTPELEAFRRKEQMDRLAAFFRSLLPGGRSAAGGPPAGAGGKQQ